MDAKESEERGRAIVQTLASVVESMVQPSDSLPMAYYPKTKFEAFRAPGISIRDYLLRIHKYASCSPECFVLALVYIDRLHQMQGFILTELNVHRVVITSVVLAAKFFDDHYFNNAYYAKVGGVPCSEMNELEVEYLLLVNFSLHVSTDTYSRYYNELANHYTFISVRNASLPTAGYRQLRHYVAADPDQDGQLVYVTDVVPEDPPPPPNFHYQPPSSQYYAQATHQHLPGHQFQHGHAGMYHPPPVHHARGSEHDSVMVPEKQHQAGAGGVSSSGIVYGSSTRTSGQKRRQSVALGVNA